MRRNPDLRIRPSRRPWLVALAALVLAVAARGNLLRNGDFEQPLEGTWDTLVANTTGGDWSFGRYDTMGQPTPGFAVEVSKHEGEYASLSQTVDVPDANLQLDFDGRFAYDTGSSRSWPVAAFIVHYLDSTGAELGNTTFYRHDHYCDWSGTDVVHLIDLGEADGWNHYQLVMRWELAENLPGIDPDRIARIRVELYSFLSGC